jgi:hypothetical protein
MKHAGLVALSLAAAVSSPLAAQSSQPTLFVANNGNSVGSVTSFHINADGSLEFIQNVVTPGSSNAQTIAIAPSGRWLCTGHGTSNGITEQLTFFEVHGDGTMSIILETLTPDSPVDVEWIDDEYLVVTNTSASPDQLIVYRFNPAVPSITQTWFIGLSSSTFDIVIDRAHNLMHARSATSSVWPLRINPDRTLTHIGAAVPTGVYFLGPGLSPDGSRLYHGGGISSFNGLSRRWIGGMEVDTTTGALTPLPNAPYLSPPVSGTSGPSPKQVVITGDGRFAYVAHGSSGDVQGFSIDKETGELTLIPGAYYDVGTQGQCSRMTTFGDTLYVLRYYSNPNPGDGVLAFHINADGTFSQIETLYATQGSLPWELVAWPGVIAECPADVNTSGAVDIDDLLMVISSWGPCTSCEADINSSGAVDIDDLLAVIRAWGPC